MPGSSLCCKEWLTALKQTFIFVRKNSIVKKRYLAKYTSSNSQQSIVGWWTYDKVYNYSIVLTKIMPEISNLADIHWIYQRWTK